jgi:hypothetical protein
MKRKVKTMGLLLGIVLAGSIMVQGQNAEVQPFHRSRTFNRIPDLTDKQKTELNTLAKKHWVKLDTLRAQMSRTEDIQKRGDIARDIQIEKDTHRQDVLALLNDKQKEVFNETGRGMRGPAYGQFGRRAPGRGMCRSNAGYGKRGHGKGTAPEMNRDNRPTSRGKDRGYWQ